MTEDTQRAEKQVAKEVAQDSASQQSRESLSHEAFSQAIKQAQSSGAGAAGREAGIAAGAAAAAAGKDSLPDVAVHEGAHGKTGIDGKSGSDSMKSVPDKNQFDKSDAHNLYKDMEKYNKSDDLSRMMKDGTLRPEDFKNKIENLLKPREGVEQLATGDYLVREDGRQSLFTPNGDRITINPDGTHVIKGDVNQVSTDKNGVTTVHFGDGARVSFDQDGFRDIERGKQAVSFGRPEPDWNRMLKPFLNPEPHRIDPYEKPNWPDRRRPDDGYAIPLGPDRIYPGDRYQDAKPYYPDPNRRDYELIKHAQKNENW